MAQQNPRGKTGAQITSYTSKKKMVLTYFSSLSTPGELIEP
jgi:hypothetical protein